METNCIFCQIAKGNLPSHLVWEDDRHMAFLSIFPNTKGVTVVIPKQHFPSYIFNLPVEVMNGLLYAAKIVAKKIDTAFDDVGRTGVVFEGFGIDHVHAKLFPLHGTKIKKWQPIKSNTKIYFEKYPGYISSHDCERVDDAALEKIAEHIRNTKVQ